MNVKRKRLLFFRPLDLLLWVVVSYFVFTYYLKSDISSVIAESYEVSINDSLYGSFPLRLDTTIVLRGHSGDVAILCRATEVAIAKTACRRRICTHQRVTPQGGEIVCVPNKLIISVVSTGGDSENVDFIVR